MTARVLKKPLSAELLQAVRLKVPGSVKILLEHGADYNVRNEKDQNVLMMAACLGCTEIVAMLAKAGAKPDEKGPNGSVALIEATSRGYLNVVEALLDNGADVNATESSNWSALHHAALHEERRDIMRLLIERGARLGIMGADGDTAMTIANGRGHQVLVDMLNNASEIRTAYRAKMEAANIIVPVVPSLSQLASTHNQLLQAATATPYVIRRRMQP